MLSYSINQAYVITYSILKRLPRHEMYSFLAFIHCDISETIQICEIVLRYLYIYEKYPQTNIGHHIYAISHQFLQVL